MASRGERMLTGWPSTSMSPASGVRQAVQDAHQGRLACAVLAQEGMDLAAGEVEVDTVVGDEVPETLGDAPKADGRITARPRWSRRDWSSDRVRPGRASGQEGAAVSRPVRRWSRPARSR